MQGKAKISETSFMGFYQFEKRKLWASVFFSTEGLQIVGVFGVSACPSGVRTGFRAHNQTSGKPGLEDRQTDLFRKQKEGRLYFVFPLKNKGCNTISVETFVQNCVKESVQFVPLLMKFVGWARVVG